MVGAVAQRHRAIADSRICWRKRDIHRADRGTAGTILRACHAASSAGDAELLADCALGERLNLLQRDRRAEGEGHGLGEALADSDGRGGATEGGHAGRGGIGRNNDRKQISGRTGRAVKFVAGVAGGDGLLSCGGEGGDAPCHATVQENRFTSGDRVDAGHEGDRPSGNRLSLHARQGRRKGDRNIGRYRICRRT